MESDLENKARKAFVDDHFELAVHLYTQAIGLNPEHAELYAERSQANIKLGNFTEAVADTNRAIELDPLMSKAFLRKGIACMKLEEYQTAKAALEKGASLAPGEPRFSNLIKECEERIAEETDGQLKQPVVQAPQVVESPATVVAAKEDSQMPTAMASKATYKHSFYQKSDEVVVTIFAKGIPHKNVIVDFGEQILSVSIEVPGDAYHFQPRLFGKIIPNKCRYEVLNTKIEIRLAKADEIHWNSLEFSKETTVPRKVDASTSTLSGRPSYPSSKAKKDWDKLEAQVKKEEKDEKLDGDAALNKFFREIYGDADEDTRRAMQKSFVESNGTVLSTNWKEVGSKKVEGSPPDGMEMKKWEY